MLRLTFLAYGTININKSIISEEKYWFVINLGGASVACVSCLQSNIALNSMRAEIIV